MGWYHERNETLEKLDKVIALLAFEEGGASAGLGFLGALF
jgi:hypothetical protein